MEPLYFYHLVPKGAKLSPGITSLKYQYKTGDMKSFIKNSLKYRVRLCTSWGIYDKKPDSLTPTEIIEGIEKFRGPNGANYIYLFRFPPYMNLGKHMGDVLRFKDIYRIDIAKLIEDGIILKNEIKDVQSGYDPSSRPNVTNTTFSRYYSMTVPSYFKNYNDQTTGPLFGTIDHIGISPRMGYIPKKYCKKIDIPNTLEELQYLV